MGITTGKLLAARPSRPSLSDLKTDFCYLSSLSTEVIKGIILTHGAGSTADAPLLVTLAAAFEQAGFRVVRHTLNFRINKPKSPPHPKDAPGDQAGLLEAVKEMRREGVEKVYLGGHSYGGRQASIMASEHPGLIAALLLLSYPLHPPEKPQQLRTAHFPNLRTPSLFIHGAKDTFGSEAEMTGALKLMPGRVELLTIPGVGHDLGGGKGPLAAKVASRFIDFISK